jgi:hypothetical protein
LAGLRIPDNQIKFFKRLLEAPADRLAELPRLLADSAPAWSASDFERRLAQDMDLDPQLIKAAAVVGFSLLATAEGGTVRPQDLPAAVVDGVAERIDLPADSAERARLEQFLRAIVESPGNFEVSRKVQYVGLEYEHLFLDARILTDVRPVFGGDGFEISTSVVVHSLRIKSREDRQERSSYFALDRDDLLQLRELIDRALKKERVIHDTLSEADIPVVRAGTVGDSND